MWSYKRVLVFAARTPLQSDRTLNCSRRRPTSILRPAVVCSRAAHAYPQLRTGRIEPDHCLNENRSIDIASARPASASAAAATTRPPVVVGGRGAPALQMNGSAVTSICRLPFFLSTDMSMVLMRIGIGYGKAPGTVASPFGFGATPS